METPFWKGDPQILGVPVFVAGSIALGLALAGYLPPGVVGGALPIILAGTGLGLLIATIWAIQLGQSFVACVFGIFLGFWWSYPILIFGLIHGWLGITAEDVKRSVAIFLIAWLVVIVFLMLAALPLPAVYPLLLFVVNIALVLILWGTLDESENLVKAGGYAVLVFAAIGVYIFMAVASMSLGGRGLPLGKAVWTPQAAR